MEKNKRTRNWVFVMYPESMPENYLDILNDLHTNVVISPLHDKDFNADGGPKKPHYHVLICFDSVKSYTQVLELTKSLNGTVPQVCNNTKGMVRYFIHIDNPEKYQYDKSLIRCLGYTDLEEYFSLSWTDKNVLMQECIDIIEKFDFKYFTDFVKYIYTERRNDLFPFVSLGGAVYFIKSYIFDRRSKWFTYNNKEEKKELK